MLYSIVPNINMYFLFILITFFSLESTSKGSTGLPSETKQIICKHSREIASECMPALLTLDRSGNGFVSLKDLAQILVSRGFATLKNNNINVNNNKIGRRKKRRQEYMVRADLKFIKALKTNKKNELNEEILANAIEAILSLQPNKLISLDMDKNGKINSEEFSLGMPIKANQSLNKAKDKLYRSSSFKRYDNNKNGYIDGSEYVTGVKSMRKIMQIRMCALCIGLADKNGDGLLSNKELVAILPDITNLPVSIPLDRSIYWLRNLSLKQIKHIQSKLMKTKKIPNITIKTRHIKNLTGKNLEYEIGKIIVPENRNDPASRSIGVGFARFRSSSAITSPPIVFLPGGPGNSFVMKITSYNLKKMDSCFDLSSMLKFSDVIFLDQRGFSNQGDVLRATHLKPKAEPISHADKQKEIASYKNFAKKVTADFKMQGIDLRGYDIKQCAHDVADLAKALNHQKIILVGISFGSQWSFAVMKMYPDLVARALLSGVEPLNHSYDMPSDVFAAYLRMWQHVNSMPEFKPYLPKGGMAEAARVVISRLEKKLYKTLQKNSSHEKKQIAYLTPESFPYYSPAEILELYHLKPHSNSTYRNDSNLADTTYNLILPLIDTSLGVTEERRFQLWNDPAIRYLGRKNFEKYLASAEDWASEDVGDYFRKAQPCKIPVVFAQGDWDTRTPIENTYEISPFFSNSHVIIAHRGGHGVLVRIAKEKPIVWSKIIMFLRNGSLNDLPNEIELQPSKFFRKPRIISLNK